MYDGIVRTTAKKVFEINDCMEIIVLYLLSYEFNTV
jgi:hypothetical protein